MQCTWQDFHNLSLIKKLDHRTHRRSTWNSRPDPFHGHDLQNAFINFVKERFVLILP
jgi:hypothetical protein